MDAFYASIERAARQPGTCAASRPCPGSYFPGHTTFDMRLSKELGETVSASTTEFFRKVLPLAENCSGPGHVSFLGSCGIEKQRAPPRGRGWRLFSVVYTNAP
jgi:hypothetical protein